MEPPVSEPKATKHKLALTATAEPPDEPPGALLLSIGLSTLPKAEFSLEQKAKDDEASLATLFRHTDGNIYLGENALDYREERLAKIK